MSLSLLYIPGPAVVAGATAGAVAFAVVHSGGHATSVATDVGLRGAGLLLSAAGERVGGEGVGANIRGSMEYLREHVVVPTLRDSSEKSAYVAGVLATAGAVVVTTAACHSATYLCKKYKEFRTPLQPEEFIDYVLDEKGTSGFIIVDFPPCEEFSHEAASSTCATRSLSHDPPLTAAAHPRPSQVASQPIPTQTV
jgi:hypothetical protein